jgi:thiol-disulfide isomerase/thioredoxin
MRLFEPSRRQLGLTAVATTVAGLCGVSRVLSDSPMTPLLPATRRPADTAQSEVWTNNIELVRHDGVPFKLATVPGRVVIVSLWGAFCSTCRAELPALMRLQNLYGPASVGIVLAGFPQFWNEDYPAAMRYGYGANVATVAPDTSNETLETAFALDGTALEVPQALVYARSDDSSGLALLYIKKGPVRWSDGPVQAEIAHQVTAPATPVLS